MPAWFVEEKNFRGDWIPCIYHSSEPPSEKKVESSKRAFRAPPQAIAAVHIGMSPRDLLSFYGQDAKGQKRLHLGLPNEKHD